jgi:hypothetical protein
VIVIGCFLPGKRPAGRGEGGEVGPAKRLSAIALENDGRGLKLKRRLWLQTFVVLTCLSAVTGKTLPGATPTTVPPAGSRRSKWEGAQYELTLHGLHKLEWLDQVIERFQALNV